MGAALDDHDNQPRRVIELCLAQSGCRCSWRLSFSHCLFSDPSGRAARFQDETATRRWLLMSEPSQKLTPSWRQAADSHGFGVLCVRLPEGERFTFLITDAMK